MMKIKTAAIMFSISFCTLTGMAYGAGDDMKSDMNSREMPASTTHMEGSMQGNMQDNMKGDMQVDMEDSMKDATEKQMSTDMKKNEHTEMKADMEESTGQGGM